VDASNKIRLGDSAVTEVETAGYMKGLTGLCIGLDCRNAWPSGDITGVSAGTGLTGSAGSGEVTLSIAPSYQLPQLCANGQVAKSTGAGGWTCANDSDTPYSAGTGLSLTGTTFSLNQSFNVTGTIGAGSFTGSGSPISRPGWKG